MVGMNDRIGLESLGRDVAGGAVSRQTVKGGGNWNRELVLFLQMRSCLSFRTDWPCLSV